MVLVPQMITVDSNDPRRLARWWAERTDGEVVAENDGWFVVVALPSGLRLGVQHVDDPTPGKNRIHLDLAAADVDAEVEALVAAGATSLGPREISGFRWVTLTDPDVNEFCVAPEGSHDPA